jgi:hypothetical protein
MDYSVRKGKVTVCTRGATYGAGDPETPVKKARPLMTPAEGLEIWEGARLVWTHNAEGVIARIDQGRGSPRPNILDAGGACSRPVSRTCPHRKLSALGLKNCASASATSSGASSMTKCPALSGRPWTSSAQRHHISTRSADWLCVPQIARTGQRRRVPDSIRTVIGEVHTQPGPIVFARGANR